MTRDGTALTVGVIGMGRMGWRPKASRSAVLARLKGLSTVIIRECLMIGDDPRDDVQGALALGMRALLVNVRQLAPADVPEAASVVPDLPAAPAAVEKILAGGTVREWAHAHSGSPER